MSVSNQLSPPPDIGPVHVSPGIGVGVVFDPTPWVEISVLSRGRMRTDRVGLNLRAGEIVLCAPYEPAGLGMVVIVRCEVDGYSPGALISAEDVEILGPALEHAALCAWDKPGKRCRPGDPVGPAAPAASGTHGPHAATKSPRHRDPYSSPFTTP